MGLLDTDKERDYRGAITGHLERAALAAVPQNSGIGGTDERSKSAQSVELSKTRTNG